MMITNNYEKAPGHWILARMGKRVLRPGGKELTHKLIGGLELQAGDEVVEFAPGLGYTASLVLKHHHKTYTGIDADQDAVNLLRRKFNGPAVQFCLGNAANTGLQDASKNKVLGEAMLTMHADHRKTEIIREAHRILVKGGLYGIHEMGLVPDDMPADTKAAIQRDLALNIKVNTRPLTLTEWKNLLQNEGFKIRCVYSNPMHLLNPKRMLDDEGLMRMIKIKYNIITHPAARKRINGMRQAFLRHAQSINAVAIIAEKL